VVCHGHCDGGAPGPPGRRFGAASISATTWPAMAYGVARPGIRTRFGPARAESDRPPSRGSFAARPETCWEVRRPTKTTNATACWAPALRPLWPVARPVGRHTPATFPGTGSSCGTSTSRNPESPGPCPAKPGSRNACAARQTRVIREAFPAASAVPAPEARDQDADHAFDDQAKRPLPTVMHASGALRGAPGAGLAILNWIPGFHTLGVGLDFIRERHHS